jgi:hypothetical protein
MLAGFLRRLRQSWQVVHLGIEVEPESTSMGIVKVLINNFWLITLLKSLYILMQSFVEDFESEGMFFYALWMPWVAGLPILLKG